MKNILLIGSPGTGKTTFANAFSEKVNVNYIHVGSYFEIISALLEKEDIFKLSKEEFIKKILSNKKFIGFVKSRQYLISLGEKIRDVHGRKIIAEMILHDLQKDKINLVDNLAGFENVKLLKENDFLVIGFICSLKTQIERRLSQKREIDPRDRQKIEEIIKKSDEYFETRKILKISDVVYVTEKVDVTSEEVIEEILNSL